MTEFNSNLTSQLEIPGKVSCTAALTDGPLCAPCEVTAALGF